MKRNMLAIAALATVAATAPAHAANVYSNSFDAPATVASGVTATLSGVTTLGQANAGTNGQFGLTDAFLRNRATGNPAAATVLTLSNLPTHTSVDIGMVFAFLDSWDSSNGSVAPDLVDIVVDGATRISGLTTGSASGSVLYYGGGTVLGSGIEADDYAFGGYRDTTVDLGTSSLLSFAHTGSTLTLSIFAYGAGWQGDLDESWGIDNLTVAVNGAPGGVVPEPATWAMMIGGFGLAGGTLRRRTRATVKALA